MTAKDVEIEKLKSSQSYEKTAIGNFSTPSEFSYKKVIDLEGKLGLVVDYQTKLSEKITELNKKVEKIEKGLLNILACKMVNLQNKIDKFA